MALKDLDNQRTHTWIIFGNKYGFIATRTRYIQIGTERSNMDKATLQRKILLCLFGMGTNTGIKSMESLPGDDYKDLLYIRRRFISNEGLRQAITQEVNATLVVRLQGIWGESTTQPVPQTLSSLEEVVDATL